MGGPEPVEIVLAFLAKINAHDVDGLCALMTPDHVFIDSLGTRLEGVERMRKGWIGYYEWFPDYRISHEEIFNSGNTVAVFGTARGTLSVAGALRKENSWEMPAAWKAMVRESRIALWQVYADNDAPRRLLAANKR